MRLPVTAIKRPVLASMMSAALILFGAIGFSAARRCASIRTSTPDRLRDHRAPGANPACDRERPSRTMLEEELSTIPGIRTLTSSQRGAVQQHHDRVHPVAGSRGGGTGRPRQGVPGQRPPAPGGRGAGRHEAGFRRSAVHVAGALGENYDLHPTLVIARSGGEDPSAGGRRGRTGADPRGAPDSMRLWLSARARAAAA